jgi:hypothetical protein
VRFKLATLMSLIRLMVRFVCERGCDMRRQRGMGHA